MKYFPEQTLIENYNKCLIYFYALSCVFGLVTCIFFALVWSHWHSTLNTCVAQDCGCILYTVTTWNMVAGGDIRLCYYVTYVHLVVFLVSLGLACYYCVQVVHDENRRRKMSMKNRRNVSNSHISSIGSGPEDSCFTPIALSSGVVSVVLLSTAYISTEGYFKTCKEYRMIVGKNLKASGNLVNLIYDRLSCTSVLDIMDYTQPNSRGKEPRGGIVNTPFLLQGAIISAWLHFLVWLLLLFYNALLARRRVQCQGTKVPTGPGGRTETSI